MFQSQINTRFMPLVCFFDNIRGIVHPGKFASQGHVRWQHSVLHGSIGPIVMRVRPELAETDWIFYRRTNTSSGAKVILTERNTAAFSDGTVNLWHGATGLLWPFPKLKEPTKGRRHYKNFEDVQGTVWRRFWMTWITMSRVVTVGVPNDTNSRPTTSTLGGFSF